MRCRDVDRLVSGYIDGALDERRSSAVRGHLRVCEECAARVEDEARLRDAAGQLAPVDPPPALWDAIDARLAEAEIADSRRPAVWLWGQRAVDTLRRWALPMSLVGAVAVGLLVLWLPRDHAGGSARRGAPLARSGSDHLATGAGVAALASTAGARDPRAASPRAASADPCAATASRDEEVLCQMNRSDRRYLDAIAELAQLAGEERAGWTAAAATRFDARLADLDRAALVERKRLAARAGVGPADRDPLYAIYQAKIEYMTRAVVGGEVGGSR